MLLRKGNGCPCLLSVYLSISLSVSVSLSLSLFFFFFFFERMFFPALKDDVCHICTDRWVERIKTLK